MENVKSDLTNRVIHRHLAKVGSTLIVSSEHDAVEKFLEKNPDHILVSQRREVECTREPGSPRVASLTASPFVEYTFQHKDYATERGPGLSAFTKTAKEETEREVRIELESIPDQVRKEATKLNILQNILEKFPGGYVRVRKETPGICTMTRKNFENHIEDNIEISEDLFNKLLPLGTSKQDKTRLKWNGWDIDELDGGKIVAEYEMEDGQSQVTVPLIFDVKKIGEHTTQTGSNLSSS